MEGLESDRKLHAAERDRLLQDERRERNWKRWGPYLAERQWGTVREDYSHDGSAWSYFPHDHARSRAYRWGEDGLLGWCDREGRACLGLALWNERDPILKERLFGLTGTEGNHGEDVKEHYFYLESSPTHSFAKALYKYPLEEFPYLRLVQENRRRGRTAPEFELDDTGVFDRGEYVDVFVEYAKADPDDTLVRITLVNRSARAARLHVLPMLWFRNTWSWGRAGEGYWPRPRLWAGTGDASRTARIHAHHESLGAFTWFADLDPEGRAPELLFTENETNSQLLWDVPNESRYVKDAFHERVIHGRLEAVNPQGIGTKAAAWYALELPAHGTRVLRVRLRPDSAPDAAVFGAEFERILSLRQAESNAYYERLLPPECNADERGVLLQAYAGLLWSKQFYHYVVADWLDGDPLHPRPPPERLVARNSEWKHLYNRDVISMPDKWEYPWYAAWDLAFHMIPFAEVDPHFAKEQLQLFLREWYMHPNGQMPAYEWALSDVNPPVHAWACWRVYKMTGLRGQRDRSFLERTFQKLLLNFTWWVNRKDEQGRNLFSGGFLGLDNIGVFDRSRPLPGGWQLVQADGTAWMAFFCATMLAMSLELSLENRSYEDLASKFFEHFVAIVDAMNAFGGSGLWDQQDGFYYDRLERGGHSLPLRVRSMVGLIPLFTVEVIDHELLECLPGFRKRMEWFLRNRADLAERISYMRTGDGNGQHLLAIPSRERLARALAYMLDEREFLSPFGLRSLSRAHADRPFELELDGTRHRVAYAPGESDTELFGGNSNWRGPIWFPVNYLMIEALERYHRFFGDHLKVELPTGSGRWIDLHAVARELCSRLAATFLRDAGGRRPCHGSSERFARDPHWKDLVLFHEYFHGDTGQGIGASHQTGWTALVTRMLCDRARNRGSSPRAALDAPPSLTTTGIRPRFQALDAEHRADRLR
jgi:hypothetical protein